MSSISDHFGINSSHTNLRGSLKSSSQNTLQTHLQNHIRNTSQCTSENSFGFDGRRVTVPPPSSNTADCWRFYNNPAISQYLTHAFRMNAVKACTVTGQSPAMDAIRTELQVLYSKTSPASGKHFTALEHKTIHDEAYKKAGCTSGSAGLWGWQIVNTAGFVVGGKSVSLREWVVGLSIAIWGRCEIPSSQQSK